MSTFTNARTAVRFEAGRYERTDGEVIEFPLVELKTALVSVSQAKKLVLTEIQGRDGSVVEYNGKSDYMINVVGTITGANGVYPTSEVLALKKMLDAPVPIEVTCDHLQNMNIHYVVVEQYDIPQDAGGISYQTFNILLRSYTPIELRIRRV
jgi:hypothetical protein